MQSRGHQAPDRRVHAHSRLFSHNALFPLWFAIHRSRFAVLSFVLFLAPAGRFGDGALLNGSLDDRGRVPMLEDVSHVGHMAEALDEALAVLLVLPFAREQLWR